MSIRGAVFGQEIGQFSSVESLQIPGPCCWEIPTGNKKKLLKQGCKFHRIVFPFHIKKQICPRRFSVPPYYQITHYKIPFLFK